MKFLRQFHCRAAWPPSWWVAVFASVYLLFTAGIWLIARGLPNFSGTFADMPENAQFFAAVIGSAAVLHALCRLLRFHPAVNFSYASWLALSPWTAAKPLPVGPIHPVWQDAAVIAVLIVLAGCHDGVNPLLPLEAFGLAYLIGLTLLLAVTATRPSFFAMGFLWPSVLLTDRKWLAVSVIFAVMALVLWHGTRKSLRMFPWRRENRAHPGLTKAPNPNSIGQMEMGIAGLNAAATASSVGWPFAQLSPKARFRSVSTATSFWTSLLIGWWACCLIVGTGMEPVPGLILLFGIGGALIRIITYLTGMNGIVPSFSFRSRLVSARLIVPGFDQIFVAPLAAIAVAVVGGMLIPYSGSWYPAAHAVLITLIWFILLAGGPTMRNWVLTGEHRFSPRFAGGGSRQPLRPV